MLRKKFLIFFFVLGIFILLIPAVDALLPPRTSLDLFLDHDVILVGVVTSEKALPQLPDKLLGTTEYEISVDRYLKKPLSLKKITAEGIGSKNQTLHVTNEVIFNTGQKVLLFLLMDEEKFVISPYSMALSGDFNEAIIPPPLKLFKNGLSVDEIVCKSDFEMLLKPSGSPVCVKPSTATNLIGRGWEKVN